MRDSVDQVTVGETTANIYYDESAESPREWDNVGTIATWHRRYRLGDVQPKVGGDDYLRSLAYDAVQCGDDTPDEHVARILAKHYVMLNVYMYDHSGISLSCSTWKFRAVDSVGWDWGRLGIIYVSMEKARKEWTGTDEEIRVKATACLESEIETYNQFVTGDVYGYAIEGGDSCWGYFGMEAAKEAAKAACEWAEKERIKMEAEEKLLSHEYMMQL